MALIRNFAPHLLVRDMARVIFVLKAQAVAYPFAVSTWHHAVLGRSTSLLSNAHEASKSSARSHTTSTEQALTGLSHALRVHVSLLNNRQNKAVKRRKDGTSVFHAVVRRPSTLTPTHTASWRSIDFTTNTRVETTTTWPPRFPPYRRPWCSAPSLSPTLAPSSSRFSLWIAFS